jgi:hypothetical protein
LFFFCPFLPLCTLVPWSKWWIKGSWFIICKTLPMEFIYNGIWCGWICNPNTQKGNWTSLIWKPVFFRCSRASLANQWQKTLTVWKKCW